MGLQEQMKDCEDNKSTLHMEFTDETNTVEIKNLSEAHLLSAIAYLMQVMAEEINSSVESVAAMVIMGIRENSDDN